MDGSRAETSHSTAPQGQARLDRFKRLLLHAAIAFHLAAVIAWSLTSPTSQLPVHRRVRSQLAPYMGWAGLWQGWAMFAPNPAMENSYLEAEVTLRDGTRAVWAPPRMERLGHLERYQKERYRKWANERVMRFGRPDPVMCDAAARYAARQVGRPDNPARSVELVRHWAEIPRPRSAARPWMREVIHRLDLDSAGGAGARPATRAAPAGGGGGAGDAPGVEE